MALFTVLIGTTPILLENVQSYDGNPSGENFFYQWRYERIYYTFEFYLIDIHHFSGYYILAPIGSLGYILNVIAILPVSFRIYLNIIF